MFLGLGLPHLTVEHVICKLNFLATHLFSSSLAGQQLRHTIEDLKFETSSATQFFKLPFSPYGRYCTSSWLTSLWFHINDLPLKLEIETAILPLQREGDILLMDQFVSQHCFTWQQLYAINQCCLFLHCYSVANIVTADGSSVRSCFSSPHHVPLASSFTWPNTKPTQEFWRLWNVFLAGIPPIALGR